MRTRYRWGRALAAALAGTALATAGCGGKVSKAAPVSPPPTAVGGRSVAASPTAAAVVDPAAVKANELGQIPVLMYHQLLARPRGDFDQTPTQFRAEVTSLYAHGYRTITAADLVAGKIDVPAGKKPMVLTFDDATVSQYDEKPDGSVDPASATGILLDVAKRAGEAHPVATFYVNAEPFARHPMYLKDLSDLGMEVAEHTFSHANLRQLSDAGVQSELAKGLAVITDAVPGVTVTTMALPFGVQPRHHALAARGAGYSFAGVFAVGSNPSPSPYSASFDPLYVPRIRSGLRTGDQAFTSTDWLPQLFSGKVTPYVSDGDPEHISFPKALASRLAPRFASLARPY
ncbi:MAG: polysaccharide deacetylase family protein [Mycobacteriales bacterium]